MIKYPYSYQVKDWNKVMQTMGIIFKVEEIQ